MRLTPPRHRKIYILGLTTTYDEGSGVPCDPFPNDALVLRSNCFPPCPLLALVSARLSHLHLTQVHSS
jgi:hypothetical protein